MDSTDRWRGEVGVIITTPDGEMLKYEVQLKFPTTNNEAKYEGILTRLRIGKALGAKNLLLRSDSKLVIGQIKEEYKAKEEKMQKAQPCTSSEKNHRERLEKKILRAMIRNLGKVKRKMRSGEV